LRRATPELTYGSFDLLEAGEDGLASERTVLAFERSLPDSLVRCAVNLGPCPKTLANAGLFQGKTLYGGLESCTLPPFSAVVVRGRASRSSSLE
jgi:hypothetical protein